MPSTTPRGLPYPLPTEPIADGATAIKNLADALDPRGELAYAELAAPKSSSNGVPATLDLVLAAPAVVVPAGIVVYVEFGAHSWQQTLQGGINLLHLFYSFNGGADGYLGELTRQQINNINWPQGGIFVRRRVNGPAPGTYVFKVGISVQTGQATINAGPGGAGQILPAHMRVWRP
jgi:hypothetical protein